MSVKILSSTPTLADPVVLFRELLSHLQTLSSVAGVLVFYGQRKYSDASALTSDEGLVDIHFPPPYIPDSQTDSFKRLADYLGNEMSQESELASTAYYAGVAVQKDICSYSSTAYGLLSSLAELKSSYPLKQVDNVKLARSNLVESRSAGKNVRRSEVRLEKASNEKEKSLCEYFEREMTVCNEIRNLIRLIDSSTSTVTDRLKTTLSLFHLSRITSKTEVVEPTSNPPKKETDRRKFLEFTSEVKEELLVELQVYRDDAKKRGVTFPEIPETRSAFGTYAPSSSIRHFDRISTGAFDAADGHTLASGTPFLLLRETENQLLYPLSELLSPTGFSNVKGSVPAESNAKHGVRNLLEEVHHRSLQIVRKEKPRAMSSRPSAQGVECQSAFPRMQSGGDTPRLDDHIPAYSKQVFGHSTVYTCPRVHQSAFGGRVAISDGCLLISLSNLVTAVKNDVLNSERGTVHERLLLANMNSIQTGNMWFDREIKRRKEQGSERTLFSLEEGIAATRGEFTRIAHFREKNKEPSEAMFDAVKAAVDRYRRGLMIPKDPANLSSHTDVTLMVLSAKQQAMAVIYSPQCQSIALVDSHRRLNHGCVVVKGDYRHLRQFCETVAHFFWANHTSVEVRIDLLLHKTHRLFGTEGQLSVMKPNRGGKSSACLMSPSVAKAPRQPKTTATQPSIPPCATTKHDVTCATKKLST